MTTNASFKDWQSDFVAPLCRQARAALGDPVRMTVTQMDLMKHIYTLQDTRKEQDKAYRRASRESGQAGQRGEHALAKKRADDAWYHETVRLAATFTIRQLREIGDMLAWKTLRNRMTVRLMASKEPSGDLPPFDEYMATVKDAAAESDKLRSYPLFTDVTNLLRHGDVLYIPWDGTRIVRIEELKGASGGERGRRERQERALRELDHLLKKGTGHFAGRLYHLRRCTIPTRSNFDKLAGLIAKARTDGVAYGQISRNHAVTVSDLTQDGRVEELLAALPRLPTDEELVGARSGDDLFDVGLLLRIEDAMLPAAPWGVYPLPDNDRLDLASLRLWYRSTINITGLLRDSAAAGAPGEVVYDLPKKYVGIRVQMPRVKHEIEMSFFLVRIGVEFLDEEVALKVLRSPAWPPPPEGSSMMFEFRDEMQLWD